MRTSEDIIGDGALTIGGRVNFSPTADVPANALNFQHNKIYAQNGSAASVTIPIHECRGTAGTIRSFRAGSIAIAVGAATVTVDLKKNGVTVLSAVITLDTGNAARVSEAGTLSTTSLAAGDLLEVVVVATAGGGTLPTGLWCTLLVDEDYA